MGVEEFFDFMPHTVTVEPQTGIDVYGKATYGPAVTYPARIVWKPKRVLGAAGQEIVGKATIYLGTNTILTDRDRLTLPAGFSPAQPAILTVTVDPDESGAHHTQVVI